MQAADLVRAYWLAMQGNDWAAVADRFLSPDYIGLWPQSGEVVSGRDAFARVNGAFPGQGGWAFDLCDLLADGDRIVTDTRVTQPDLGLVARAITFHRVAGGLIAEQREFWPDAYPVPDWRAVMLPVDPVRAPF